MLASVVGLKSEIGAALGDVLSLLRNVGGSVPRSPDLAKGGKAFPTERLAVFSAGRVLLLDNFRRLVGFGWAGADSDGGDPGCQSGHSRACGTCVMSL